jgi:hypothetical protein
MNTLPDELIASIKVFVMGDDKYIAVKKARDERARQDKALRHFETKKFDACWNQRDDTFDRNRKRFEEIIAADGKCFWKDYSTRSTSIKFSETKSSYIIRATFAGGPEFKDKISKKQYRFGHRAIIYDMMRCHYDKLSCDAQMKILALGER